jgi:hypothetical protein
MVLLVLAQGSAFGAFNALKDPALIGWWTCDEGEGEVVADSSPNGNDGRFINGAPAWREGMYGNAITINGPTLVEVPAMGLTLSAATMAGWIFAPAAQPEWASFIMHRAPGPASGFNMLADRQLAYHWNDASDTWSYRPGVYHPLNEWAHCAVTVEPAKAVFYLNGVASATNTVNHPPCAWDGPIWLGGDNGADWVARRMSGGSLDDVCFFSRALTEAEIQAIMQGLSDPALAAAPSPADGATDVHQDATFSWVAGETATAHDVYLGASFEDVNNASRAAAGDVLASQGQADTTFVPAALELGTTCYWRIDEVDASGTILKGDVWSFTVEPFAYPVANITATASSEQAGMVAQNTVNGSGLSAADEHSTELTQMWMSTGVLPNWIQYEFDGVYKLHELWVWNSNQMIEPFIGFGAKGVTLEYSTDGETWTALEGVPEFAQATGSASYTANTTVDLGGVMAKYVKLTVNQTWGGVAPQTGLAEVRFLAVPVQAREPQPAAGATDVAIDTDLDWRPGREATSHEVYFGADANALTLAGTVDDHGFTPTGLEFATEYFWRVDEAGDAGTYTGDVWSFTTEEFATIDGMESYNDDDNRIYDAWIDGLTDSAKGGSQVGYDVSPFAEKAITHSGKQSMPLMYNNEAAPFVSEAESTFASAQNWTVSAADSLVVYFRGVAPAFAETASGSIFMNAIGADIWGTADAFRYAYKSLNGDGTMVARVESLHQSDVWAKAGVMIRQTIEPGSTHAFMPITPGGSGAGNGASFQRRLVANLDSTNNDNTGAVVAAPYWVKVERKGNNFSGYISPDGTTWTQLGAAQSIVMPAQVLIGLALTSHSTATMTSAEFSNVSTTGNVTGAWQIAEIGVAQPAGNSLEGLYVSVTDSSGKTATVQHPEAAATALSSWQQWQIPLSDFAGVKTNAVKSMTIGVGNKAAPVKGGSGIVYVDDIGFGRSAQ